MIQVSSDRPRWDRFQDIKRVDLGLKVEEARASGEEYRLLLFRVRNEHFVRCGSDHAKPYSKLMGDLEEAGIDADKEKIDIVASLMVHFTKHGEERVGTNLETKLGKGKFEQCEISGAAARQLLGELCPELKIVEGTDW